MATRPDDKSFTIRVEDQGGYFHVYQVFPPKRPKKNSWGTEVKLGNVYSPGYDSPLLPVAARKLQDANPEAWVSDHSVFGHASFVSMARALAHLISPFGIESTASGLTLQEAYHKLQQENEKLRKMNEVYEKLANRL